MTDMRVCFEQNRGACHTPSLGARIAYYPETVFAYLNREQVEAFQKNVLLGQYMNADQISTGFQLFR